MTPLIYSVFTLTTHCRSQHLFVHRCNWMSTDAGINLSDSIRNRQMEKIIGYTRFYIGGKMNWERESTESIYISSVFERRSLRFLKTRPGPTNKDFPFPRRTSASIGISCIALRTDSWAPREAINRPTAKRLRLTASRPACISAPNNRHPWRIYIFAHKIDLLVERTSVR